MKRPLGRRVRYAYPDQPTSDQAGTLTQPPTIARVLDDGTAQVTQASYNAQGMVTSRTDAAGHNHYHSQLAKKGTFK